MIAYTLPQTINIDGIEYQINQKGDYRIVLDIITALNDDSLSPEEKNYCSLYIFFDGIIPDNWEIATVELNKFIDCGIENEEQEEKNNNSELPLMSWETDFIVICDDINAKYGIDIRGLEYLHWWTFVSYYKNLGEGQFNTIVSIRKKLQKHQKLEKWEQEFYNNNRKKIDINKSILNSEEKEFIEYILTGGE